MKKQTGPWWGLALLGLLALAVAAGGTAWLHTGWQAIGVTLTDEIADASQLEGFTLTGLLHWSNGGSTLHFALQDGALETALHLDDADLPQHPAELYTDRTLAVRPQDRDAVNEAARVSQTLENGTRILKSETKALRRMYTLRLPDGTSLRLAGEDLTTEGPVEVRVDEVAVRPDVTVSPLNNAYDYTNNDLVTAENFPVWSPAAAQPFALGAGYGLCWQQAFLGRAPGLYRARGLTTDEINALPADGVRYDKEVLCGSTEIGSLEPFYCPADVRLALAGASMGDGATLLVYLNREGTLCADLVNAAGQRTDHRELGPLLPDAVVAEALLLPRRTDGDALLKVRAYSQVEDGIYRGAAGQLAVLRAENGRFTVARAFDKEYADSCDAAVLSTDGGRLLLAYDKNTASANRVTYRSVPTTTHLRVYELDTGHMTYMGRVETGSERDWATTGAYREILYDTLQQDGGTLP